MTSLEKELFASFQFFIKEANHDPSSAGYGLILDDTRKPDMASIASVGFGLSSYVIGVENGYIERKNAIELVKGTFRTFLSNMDHFHGFYIHFLDMSTAQQTRKCEYSTIDTVIFFNGAITCDSYFDDEDIHSLFKQLFDRLDFRPFIKTHYGSQVFRMAYNPIQGGDYRSNSDDPWIYQWHMYAEQLSMYFIAAATDSLTSEEAIELFMGFERNIGSYGGYEYIYSPTNALFIYQYSHAWLDFRNLIGPDGIDWFANSKKASLGNRQYCIDQHDRYPILNEKSWGLTACLTPEGYRNQCVLPNDLNKDFEHISGVLPPSGSIGSIVFTEKESLEVIDMLEEKFPAAFQKYGYTDGISYTDENKLWISDGYIGINKGITVLMIDNYLHGTTWKYYMKHPLIQKAIRKLSFRKKEE